MPQPRHFRRLSPDLAHVPVDRFHSLLSQTNGLEILFSSKTEDVPVLSIGRVLTTIVVLGIAGIGRRARLNRLARPRHHRNYVNDLPETAPSIIVASSSVHAPVLSR